jgi:microcystin-dependent protein
MADPFVAEIRIFPFNFAPTGWAFCDGQLMPLSQNTALFSLLGTTYGGDGKSTFALPNLQGAAPMHPGQGPGLSLHDLGEMSGTETVTLLPTEIPAHNHQALAHSGFSTQTDPAGNAWSGSDVSKQYNLTPDAGKFMNDQALTLTGGNLPHNNLAPYLVLNFCIALQGVFPPRT